MTCIRIEGISYPVSLPFSVCKTHEGGLDQAAITIRHSTRLEAFAPYTRAFFEGEWWVIANDHCVREKFIQRATHDIQLVELAKELEGVVCGAKTFTDPLCPDPVFMQRSAIPVYSRETYITTDESGFVTWGTELDGLALDSKELELYVSNEGEYITPWNILEGGVPMPPAHSRAWRKYGQAGSYIPSEATAYYSINFGDWIEYSDEQEENGFRLENISVSDNVRIKYAAWISAAEYYNYRYCTTFEIEVGDSTIVPYTRKPLTIFETVERMLITAEPTLDANDRAYFHTTDLPEAIDTKTLDAPELSFANSAFLKENIDQIAKILHAKTKMTVDKEGRTLVYFVPITVPQKTECKGIEISEEVTFDIAKYAGRIETNAVNLTIKNEREGVLTEPFSTEDRNYLQVSKTLRAATTEARISDTTGEIETALPIKNITKLLLRLPGETDTVDITKYVCEETTYLSLSSYCSDKSVMLYFTRGTKNIKGLFFQQEDAISQSFQDYAIENIYNHATGTKMGDSIKKADLSFIVEYEPYMDLRLINSRTDGKGGRVTYVANQSAQESDKDALAAFVHGTIQEMASDAPKKTFLFGKNASLPKVGYIYDGNTYISEITYERYPHYTKASLSLSENFNQLGQYVEVANAVREYEISTKNIYNRSVLYADVCTISKEKKGDGRALITADAREEILRPFCIPGNTMLPLADRHISFAHITTYGALYDENTLVSPTSIFKIREAVLPVASFGFGNSLVFATQFEDNHSAGRIAKPTAGENNLQEYVSYGDAYGCAEFCDFVLGAGINATADCDLLTLGQTLPNYPKKAFATATAATGMEAVKGEKLCLFKDSRETIVLVYQLLLESDCNLIVGNDLANTCSLVRNYYGKTVSNAILNLYSYQIDPINGCVQNGDILSQEDMLTSGIDSDGTGYLRTLGSLPPHRSWSIVRDGKFLLGCNSPLSYDEPLYFNFHHK